MQVVGCLVLLVIFLFFGGLVIGSCAKSCGCTDDPERAYDKNKGIDWEYIDRARDAFFTGE
ncbi:MAG: hypothetical protein GY861_04345 [bacterium]|nr:hypothetical protein [bacterium]